MATRRAGHERETRGARLVGDAAAALTLITLRECVYGGVARNFRDRGDALQSFAKRFKPLRRAGTFERV